MGDILRGIPKAESCAGSTRGSQVQLCRDMHAVIANSVQLCYRNLSTHQRLNHLSVGSQPKQPWYLLLF